LASTQTLTNKTLAFLQTNIITDSATTGADATLPSGDIADGVVRLTNASLTSISGITAGGTSQFITIENQTGNTITINNDDSGASVGNRIYTGTATNVSLIANTTITLNYDPTVAHWMLQGVTSGAKSAPTQQIFLSGSGTYTTPVGVLYIEVEMIGGGGGGGGGGADSNPGTGGGTGGTTTFGTSLLTATGGGGGGPGSIGQGGGFGGSASITGGTGIVLSGGTGGVTGGMSAASGYFGGGGGASSPFGGAGAGGQPGSTTGYSAVANTGSGAGGGGSADVVANYGGGCGGGAGGYIKVIITTPAPSYGYAVGVSGTGGAGGASNGGTGGSGYICVTEYYQ
jgi:hypothetical protein